MELQHGCHVKKRVKQNVLVFTWGLGTAVGTWKCRDLPALPGRKQPKQKKGNSEGLYCHLRHLANVRFLRFSFLNGTDFLLVTWGEEMSPFLKSALPLK